MNEFGKHIGTRNEAIRLRERLLSAFKNDEKVCMDFSDVKSLNTIFANELYGKLTNEYDINVIKQNLLFHNANYDIMLTIDKAYKNKLQILQIV